MLRKENKMSKGIKASENKAKDTESVKLSLSVKDRLAFGSLFLQQGDIISQILARDMSIKVQPTQAEIKKIDLKTIKSKVGEISYSWNPKAKAVNIIFTNAEIEFLREQVGRLDKEKKVTVDMLELCLKIRGN